ncbi:MAG: hypothetical protein HXY20_11860 [Acidobacteria bacterium]|nr:hypothetical protein [Acidobacteriota bacterium]
MKDTLESFHRRDRSRQVSGARIGTHAAVPHSEARTVNRHSATQRSGAPGDLRSSAYALRAGLAVVMLFAVAPDWARESPAAQESPPGVAIRADAQPGKATVGDPIRIEITATLPEGLRASVAPVPGQLGEFTVLEFQDGRAIGKSGAPRRTGAPMAGPHVLARISVALYRPGEFEFPSLPVVLRTADGKEYSAVSPPVKVQILSVLGPQDDKLKGLKRQAEIEEPGRWLYWLGLVLLPLLAIFIAWLLRRRRRRPFLRQTSAPCLDPFASAEAELRDLLSRGFLERGQIKHFYVALTEIVKRVIEAGYGIPTTEKTTSEIMDMLSRHPDAGEPANDSARIESFLIACDLVKFARYVPPAAENELAVREAFDLLEQCRQRAGRAAPALAEEVTGVPLR